MATITFSWTKPTTRADGTELESIVPLSYKLYMDDTLWVDNIGELTFSATEIPEGPHSFSVTAFDETYRLESAKSEPVSVNFTRPAAPAGFTVSFVV